MKRNLVRASLVVLALALMLSLAGCTLVFSVVGSDTYEFDGTGITNGPIKVDVTLKGLWPVWPDTLTVVLSGTVNPVIVLDASNPDDVALANQIEDEIFSELDAVTQFQDVQAEGLLTDDVFNVTAIMEIPNWTELLPSGASSMVTIPDINLEALLKPEQYEALLAGFTQACLSIPVGNTVELNLDGTLENAAKDKLVGDMQISFILNGAEI